MSSSSAQSTGSSLSSIAADRRSPLAAILAFILVVLGLVAAPPAVAAQPLFECASLYSINQNTHELSRVDAVTGTQVANGVIDAPAGQAVNGLALPLGGGQFAWAYNRTAGSVLRYDATAETTTAFPTGLTDTTLVIGGAINPVNGIYYFATGGSPWRLYAFDTTTETLIGQVATVSGLFLNGDMAFDRFGNLYFASSDNATAPGVFARVPAPIPTTAGTVALAAQVVSDTPGNLGAYNSVAVSSDGTIAIGTATIITRVVPESGAALTSTPGFTGIADMASCAYPNHVAGQTILPGGRAVPGDQFRVQVTGPDVENPYIGITEGDDPGRQDQPAETAGRVLAVDGVTYNVTQTGVGTTSLSNYTTTWQCLDRQTGAVLASGSGSSAAVTVPTAVSSSDILCEFTNLALIPEITLDKRVVSVTDTNANGVTDAGDRITWEFDVTNTGDVALDPVRVDDDILAAAGIAVACAPTALAIGAAVTCTAAPYSITAADVTAGSVVNTATAVGTPTDGRPAVTSAPDTTQTPVAAVTPALTLVKATTSTQFAVVGDRIPYTFTVTNSGNVVARNIAITDPQLDAAAVCDTLTLAPAAVATCVGAHTVTQADLDADVVTNVATATGTAPDGDGVRSPEDTVTVPGPGRAPALTLDKATTSTVFDAVGEQIPYTFVVTNTGTVTVDGITIVDALLDAAATCDVRTLAPGAAANCAGTHTVTQADLDAGSVQNTATANGQDPADTPVASPPDSVTVVGNQQPAIALEKSAGIASYAAVDQVIPYSFLVTNTGTVTLTGITVNDPPLDAPATCAATPLAPGAAMTCTGAHTVTQADIDAASVTNTATAAGSDPTGTPVVSTPDSVIVPGPQSVPAIALDKATVATTYDAVGDVVPYTFAVTNNGTVTLRTVAITDAQLDGPAVCLVTTLAPGASTSCTGSHTVTQADLDAGRVVNTATVAGLAPNGDPVVSQPDSVTVTAIVTPSITLQKESDTPSFAVAGDVIAYTFTLTNTGTVTLSPVAVVDAQLEREAVCESSSLAPAAVTTCTGEHIVTQADVDGGAVRNVAQATGTPPGGVPPVLSPPSEVTVPGPEAAPQLILTKTAMVPEYRSVGDLVAYTFAITNSGNVTVNQVSVTDPQLDAAALCDTADIGPGETANCTGAHTVTRADLESRSIVNVASATGVPVRCAGGAAECVVDSESAVATVRAMAAPRALPPTGGVVDVALLGGAGMLLALGAVLMVRSRRKARNATD